MFVNPPPKHETASVGLLRVTFGVAALLLFGYTAFFVIADAWWNHRIAQVTEGMNAREVVRLLGPLPPKLPPEEVWHDEQRLAQLPDVNYCVEYFFFNGGPAVDLCFTSDDTVVLIQAWGFRIIST